MDSDEELIVVTTSETMLIRRYFHRGDERYHVIGKITHAAYRQGGVLMIMWIKNSVPGS